MPRLKNPTMTDRVMHILTERGHVTEATAHAEFGRFRVADAVYRIRHKEAHRIPAGMEIITVNKTDSKGHPYGEWQLVPKQSQKEAA